MFPKALPLPDDVIEAREKRKVLLIRSARLGVFLRCLIVLMEIIFAVVYGSAALLLDALHCFSDVVSSCLVILCIVVAARPPDSNHPLGHGRYEPIMGFIMSIAMIILGGAMFLFHTRNLFSSANDTIEQSLVPWLWIIPLAAIGMLESGYWIVNRTAKKMQSSVLAVDALHYRIDAITSFVALFVLLLAAYFPMQAYLFDQAGAVLIAVIMVVLGLWAARNSLKELTDTSPSAEYFCLVENAALSVPGVCGTEKLRIQAYGPDALVTIDIEVDPELPVKEAHTISQQVRLVIQKKWPAVRDVIVHVEPYYPNDH